MLELSTSTTHTAYYQDTDPERLYQQRGLVFARLVDWADEALSLLR